jgi:acyl-[acyl-carrier-protein] desaturase
MEDLGNVNPSELLHPSRVLRVGRETIANTGLLEYPGEPNQIDAMRELEPVVERELNRHNAQRRTWVPHDFLPIDDEGRIIDHPSRLDEDRKPLIGGVALSAMVVNLLTEDNLPSYHRVIANNFGLDGPWGTWTHQWTTEEDNHAYVMRSFLDLTQAINPADLEKKRMDQMMQGYNVEKDPLHTLAYVTFQELATRVSHRQTGIATKNDIADEMLKRIAADENMHMLFYRNLADSALDVAPAQMMRAIIDEIKDFTMPGSNIQGFRLSALEIANAGIYDTPRHYEEVIMPVIKKWRLFERDLGPQGDVLREELSVVLEDLSKKVDKFNDQRDSGALARMIDALRRRS